MVNWKEGAGVAGMRGGRGRSLGTDPALTHMTREVILAHRRLSTQGAGTADPPVRTEVPGSLTGPQALLTERRTEQAAATMGSPSAPPCRALLSWQWLLLAGKEGIIPGGGWKDGRQGLAKSPGENCSEKGGKASLWA